MNVLSDVTFPVPALHRRAEFMMQAGCAVSAIGRILIDDLISRDTGEDGLIRGIDVNGLLMALVVIGDKLQVESEDLEVAIEKRSENAGSL